MAHYFIVPIWPHIMVSRVPNVLRMYSVVVAGGICSLSLDYVSIARRPNAFAN